MKFLTKPERWQCCATSFAMALDITVEEMLARLGHDGGHAIFPCNDEPTCRRGHHIQECITVALTLGYAVTPVQMVPVIASPNSSDPNLPVYFGGIPGNWMRFGNAIQFSRGVIEGKSSACGHMVAYDHGMIFDPDRGTYNYSREECERRNFIAVCAWRIDRLEKV